MLGFLMALAALALYLLAALLLLGGVMGFVNPGSVGAKSRVGALLQSWLSAGVCLVLGLLLGLAGGTARFVRRITLRAPKALGFDVTAPLLRFCRPLLCRCRAVLRFERGTIQPR